MTVENNDDKKEKKPWTPSQPERQPTPKPEHARTPGTSGAEKSQGTKG